MAASGHDVAIVQLFGRWGSSVVLRYVRESALGVKGGNLARRTESTLADAQDKLVSKIIQERPGQPSGVVAAIRDKELERIATRLLRDFTLKLPANGAVEELASEISRLQLTMQDELDVVTGARRPDFIQCAGGRAHATIDSSTTLCGWSWGGGNTTALLTHQWDQLSASEKCKGCLKRGSFNNPFD
jgi:hypothetical protein